MAEEGSRVRGVVSEVGLERDEDQFRSFNLKIGVVVRAGKSLNYDEGERMMRQFRKDLLGKEVELSAVVSRCPLCGKAFNSESGLKQHMRIAHEEKKKPKAAKKIAEKKKDEKKKPSPKKKEGSKPIKAKRT